MCVSRIVKRDPQTERGCTRERERRTTEWVGVEAQSQKIALRGG